uniref:polynucleotide adenylyltransferase n=1 Tax=Meloidogyne floridensis TaxID=298350 RepID=A0A915NG04_9BILA
EIENNGEIKEIVNIDSSIETQRLLEQKTNKGKDKLFQITENSQDVVEFIKDTNKEYSTINEIFGTLFRIINGLTNFTVNENEIWIKKTIIDNNNSNKINQRKFLKPVYYEYSQFDIYVNNSIKHENKLAEIINKEYIIEESKNKNSVLNFLEKEIMEWIKKVKQMKGINEFNDENKDFQLKIGGSQILETNTSLSDMDILCILPKYINIYDFNGEDGIYDRLIYSNIAGYLSGSSLAIMSAKICIIYPNASLPIAIKQFFIFYKLWGWPQPILLNELENEFKKAKEIVEPWKWINKEDNSEFENEKICSGKGVSCLERQPVDQERGYGTGRGGEGANEIINKTNNEQESIWEELIEKLNWENNYEYFILILCKLNENVNCNKQKVLLQSQLITNYEKNVECFDKNSKRESSKTFCKLWIIGVNLNSSKEKINDNQIQQLLTFDNIFKNYLTKSGSVYSIFTNNKIDLNKKIESFDPVF